MLEENFPYGMVSRNQQHNYISHLLVQAAYVAGDTVLAAKITRSVRKDLQQQLSYYAALNEDRAGNFDYIADQSGRKGGDKNMAEQLLMRLQSFEQQFKNPVVPPAENTVPITTQPMTPQKQTDTQRKK